MTSFSIASTEDEGTRLQHGHPVFGSLKAGPALCGPLKAPATTLNLERKSSRPQRGALRPLPDWRSAKGMS